MNRASLDRGFGRCIVLRKYGTSLKKYANRTQDRIVLPAAAAAGPAARPAKFRLLDRDGIAAAGEILTQGTHAGWCGGGGGGGSGVLSGNATFSFWVLGGLFFGR